MFLLETKCNKSILLYCTLANVRKHKCTESTKKWVKQKLQKHGCIHFGKKRKEKHSEKTIDF